MDERFNSSDRYNELIESLEKKQAELKDRIIMAEIQKEYREKEKLERQFNKLQKQLAKERREEDQKERAKQIREEHKNVVNIVETMNSGVGKILGQYEKFMKEYSDMQQVIAYNLGGMTNYNALVKTMSVLTTNAYVKQNEVYKNLQNLVQNGITTNVAQRAFLQTATNQVGIQFNAIDESLNRLIQLQHEDLTESRVAQMAGLKTFLQQNYQTSQYINNGFNNLSQQLLEAQSLLTAQAAIGLETVLQKWVGGYASSGASSQTISSLQSALGQLGSGDVTGLMSSGMGSLFAMGASRAGLSFGDLLANGMSSNTANQLMESVLGYAASLGTNNNVATNAIAKVFGLNVSDIRAAQQSGYGSLGNATYSTDIRDFLADLANSTNLNSKFNNLWENLMSGAALNTNYASYRIATGAAGIAGDLANMIPFVGALTGGKTGEILSNAVGLGYLLSGIFGENSGVTLENLFDIGSWADTFGLSSGSLYSDYKALGHLALGAEDITGSTGFTRSSNLSGVSNSMSAFKGGSGSLNTTATVTQTNTYEGQQIERTISDVYNALNATNQTLASFPTTTFATVTQIADSANAVVIGSADTTALWTDMIITTAVSAQNIYALLENAFAGGTNTIIDMTGRLTYSFGDWAGSSAHGSGSGGA